VNDLPTAEDVLNDSEPLHLDPNFDGCCPCATIKGQSFVVKVHCWRTGPCCPYSGVHVTGRLDAKTRLKIADHVARHSGWWDHTDWTLSLEKERF